MATGPQPGELPQPGLINQGEAILKSMDREIISLKRQVRPYLAIPRYLASLETFSSYVNTIFNQNKSFVFLGGRVT